MFRETVEPFGEDAHPRPTRRHAGRCGPRPQRSASRIRAQRRSSESTLPMTAMTEELCDDVFGLGAVRQKVQLKETKPPKETKPLK